MYFSRINYSDYAIQKLLLLSSQKLAQFDRQLRPLVANVLDNRENWRKLDEGDPEKSRFKETGV